MSRPDCPAKKVRPVDLIGRLAVRPAEVATLLGIGETKARELMPELPTADLAGVRVVPLDALRRWLLDRTENPLASVPRDALNLIESLSDLPSSRRDGR